MNGSPTLLALVMLKSACGRPLPSADSGGETSTDGATTSTSTDDTTSSTTNLTSGHFLTVPDAGEIINCDPFGQDCPEGQKCVPYSSHGGGSFDDDKCVPVLGDKPPGEPCTSNGTLESTDDCDASSFCWSVPDGMLVCQPLCGGTPDDPVCPEGSTCQIMSDGTIPVCLSPCNPLARDCSEGFACYWTSSIAGFQCLSTIEDIPPGQPCVHINGCAGGSMCMGARALPSCAGSACCSPFCQLGGDGQECMALVGSTCSALFEEGTAPPGYDQVGVCIVPP